MFSFKHVQIYSSLKPPRLLLASEHGQLITRAERDLQAWMAWIKTATDVLGGISDT